jgi:NitT/TauT family transport system substrate-binding protein
VRRSTWVRSLITATAFVLPQTGRAQTTPAVRVGDAPGDPFAQGYYAVENGAFTRAGLHVDFQTFPSGGPIAEALAAGSVDIGIGTTIQIANAVTHGLPFVIIAPGCINTKAAPSGFMIAGKNSPLRTAKDFEGKTVGLSQKRSITELALIAWMQKNGADPDKVKTIEVPFAQMGAAIEHGTVDAAITTEPGYTTFLRGGTVRFVADVYSAVAPSYLLSAWITTRDYAAKNRDVVRRFLAAMLDVSRWANRHHPETAVIIAKAFGMDPSIATSMQRSAYAEALRASDVTPAIDIAVAHGIVPRAVPASDLLLSP